MTDSIFWTCCKHCGESLGPFASRAEAERALFCCDCDWLYDNAPIERDDRFAKDLLAGFDWAIEKIRQK